MSEILKVGDFHPIAWLAVVQIIDYLRARVKPNEVKIEFFADRIEVRNCSVRNRAARTKFAHQ